LFSAAVIRAFFAVLAIALLQGCGGGGTTARPAVAVFVREPSSREGVEQSLRKADLGVDFRSVAPPEAVVASTGKADLEVRLLEARADYMAGELARVRHCAERLDEPSLVWNALAQKQRSTAARILLWKIACTSIARRDEAAASAKAFASLELDLPPEVDAVSVEAHRTLASAIEAAERNEKRDLVVRVVGFEPPHAAISLAQLSVDGRTEVACSKECVVPLRPGDHLLRLSRDGYSPLEATVHVDAPTSFEARMKAAPPEVAGQQWVARFGVAGPSVRTDSNDSVELLALALRAQRFVYLEGEGTGRVRGALAVQGKIVAREEKQGSPEKASPDVVEQLLVTGGVVKDRSLLKKPLFWIAVGVVAVGSSLLTAYALSEPDERTVVRTR